MQSQIFMRCKACNTNVMRRVDFQNNVVKVDGPEPCGLKPPFPCRFDGTATIDDFTDSDVFFAYFTCVTCAQRILAPYWRDQQSSQRIHCGCGGALAYVGAAPKQLLSAYRSNEGWANITQAIVSNSQALRGEAASQERIRAYLIEKGYGFLGGQGEFEKQPVTNAEFTTWAPDWSIEEVGFSGGQVRLVPRNLHSKMLGTWYGDTTWPDFVVWTGQDKLVIELKAPRGYVLGDSDKRFWSKGGSLIGREAVLDTSNGKQTFQIPGQLGFTGAWLLHYAREIHIEAYWRKVHTPATYVNVFLIDLEDTNQTANEARRDLEILSTQTTVGDIYNNPIFSANWWRTYFPGGVRFFHNSQLLNYDGTLAPTPSHSIDQIANIFSSVTTCTKCQAHIPTSHRNLFDVCRVCLARMENICIRCGAEGGTLCKLCSSYTSAAQMICNHPKTTQQERETELCAMCFETVLSPQHFHPNFPV